jgi:hypothetical protein
MQMTPKDKDKSNAMDRWDICMATKSNHFSSPALHAHHEASYSNQ